MIDTRHGMAQVIFIAEKDGQVEVALLLEE
jgi:hypothetical protein